MTIVIKGKNAKAIYKILSTEGCMEWENVGTTKIPVLKLEGRG